MEKKINYLEGNVKSLDSLYFWCCVNAFSLEGCFNKLLHYCPNHTFSRQCFIVVYCNCASLEDWSLTNFIICRLCAKRYKREARTTVLKSLKCSWCDDDSHMHSSLWHYNLRDVIRYTWLVSEVNIIIFRQVLLFKHVSIPQSLKLNSARHFILYCILCG